MEQDDKFQLANLPFERGEILFSKGFLYLKGGQKVLKKIQIWFVQIEKNFPVG